MHDERPRSARQRLSKAIIEVLLLTQGFISFGLSLLFAVYVFVYWRWSVTAAAVDVWSPWPLVVVVTLLGLLGAAALLARGDVTTDRPRRRVTLTYLALSGVLCWLAFDFFRTPMHNVALWFHSHGRFGCNAMEAYGFRVHWLNDLTLPWILFAMVPLLYLALVGPRALATEHRDPDS
jgi:hypothetical protein